MITEHDNVKLTFKSYNANIGFYDILIDGAIKNSFMADLSHGWETMRHAYAEAMRAYNELVTIEAAMPCF